MSGFAPLDFPDRATATTRRRTFAPGLAGGPRLADILRAVDLPPDPDPAPGEAAEAPPEPLEPALVFTETELAAACGRAAAAAARAARDEAQAEHESQAQRLRAEVAEAVQAMLEERTALLARTRELATQVLRAASRRMLAGVLAERAPDWLAAIAGEPWQRLASARLEIRLPAADRELWAAALAPLAARADLVLADQPDGPCLRFEREPGWLEIDLGRWLESFDEQLRAALASPPSHAPGSPPP